MNKYPGAFILQKKLIKSFGGIFMNVYYERKCSHFFVQGKPNKYDCPICGRKGIYKDKYRRELCLKCEFAMKNKGCNI